VVKIKNEKERKPPFKMGPDNQVAKHVRAFSYQPIIILFQTTTTTTKKGAALSPYMGGLSNTNVTREIRT
jgi:hypothetical protein